MAGNIRERTTPEGKPSRFKRLRELTCFPEVDARIRKGWPLRSLAIYIQEECGEYTDITFQSLITTLNDYRKSLPPAELVKDTMPEIYAEAERKMREGLDEIEEYEDLYWLQRDRIAIDYASEKKINKLFKTTVREVVAAAEILKMSADLKMDLGINQRQLGKLNIDANLMAEVRNKYGKSPIINVINNPSSRRKIENILEKALSKSGGLDLLKQKIGWKPAEDRVVLPVSAHEVKSE
jgi:hypothetical protein